MRRLAFAVFSILVICLAGVTVAQAKPIYRPWLVDVGAGARVSNEDSDFGFSEPLKATLDYIFDEDPCDDDYYVGWEYAWSTSDDIHGSSWGIDVGARTSRPLYVTGALSYDWINSNTGHVAGIGGLVGTGYNFTPNPRVNGGPFVEAKYVFMPARTGVNNNFLNFGLGYRF